MIHNGNESNQIDGVLVTQLRQIVDERGAVLHMLRVDTPDFDEFGEIYFSEVVPGAVKAWKRHGRQTQNFAVPSGRIRLVIFDDREGSRTRGNLQTLEVGRPDAYCRVRVPPGLWYGFACIGEAPALLANCADMPHDPSESTSLQQNDPSVPYQW